MERRYRRHLLHAGSQRRRGHFYLYSFLNGSVRKLGRLPQTLSQGTPSLVVSPDGQWLLYASVDHVRSDIKLRRTLAADDGVR